MNTNNIKAFYKRLREVYRPQKRERVVDKDTTPSDHFRQKGGQTPKFRGTPYDNTVYGRQ